MTTQPTVEELKTAADVLERANKAGLRTLLDADIVSSTHFLASAQQLRIIADELKPFRPIVRVRSHIGRPVTSVFVEKPDGNFVGVYVGTDGGEGYKVIEDTFVNEGTRVYGPGI